jgi:hypothetical protein
VARQIQSKRFALTVNSNCPATTTINDSLEVGDAVSWHSSFGTSRAKRYSFSGQAGQVVGYLVNSLAINGLRAFIYDSSHTVLYADVFSAHEAYFSSQVMLPADGTYWIEVTATAGVDLGEFSLRYCVFLSHPGALTDESPESSVFPGAPAQSYSFDWAEGDVYRLFAASTEIANTVLIVLDSGGNFLQFDDDSGQGTLAMLDFVVPADGTYSVEIVSWDSEARGTVNLGLACISIPEADFTTESSGALAPTTLSFTNAASGSYDRAIWYSGFPHRGIAETADASYAVARFESLENQCVISTDLYLFNGIAVSQKTHGRTVKTRVRIQGYYDGMFPTVNVGDGCPVESTSPAWDGTFPYELTPAGDNCNDGFYAAGWHTNPGGPLSINGREVAMSPSWDVGIGAWREPYFGCYYDGEGRWVVWAWCLGGTCTGNITPSCYIVHAEKDVLSTGDPTGHYTFVEDGGGLTIEGY